MTGPKLTERVGLPLSLHTLERVRVLARQHQRKYLDQIRFLIETGLRSQEAETEIKETVRSCVAEALASYGISKRKRHRARDAPISKPIG